MRILEFAFSEKPKNHGNAQNALANDENSLPAMSSGHKTRCSPSPGILLRVGLDVLLGRAR